MARLRRPRHSIRLNRRRLARRTSAEAPFELLFLDGGGFKQAPFEEGPLAIDLLGPGGLMVIDDLTHGLAGHDPAREFLLSHPELVARS